MSFFTPDQMFNRIWCITPEYLKQNGIKALLLDVDNTLTCHGSQELPEKVSAWLCEMKRCGIKMMIVSNNTAKRVQPFAKSVGLDYTAFCIKPSPLGPRKAVKALKVKKSETALVGDQIFTDMYAAKLYGIKILMVQPMHDDTIWTIRLKRLLEKPFLWLYYKKGGTIK